MFSRLNKVITRIIIYTVLVIIVLAAISCRNSYYGSDVSYNASDLADALVSEYYEHPVNWNSNIRGDVVTVIGTVRSVVEDGVVFRSGIVPHAHLRKLVCKFANPNTLYYVRTGDSIVVKGTVDTVLKYFRRPPDSRSAILVDCELLEHNPNKVHNVLSKK